MSVCEKGGEKGKGTYETAMARRYETVKLGAEKLDPTACVCTLPANYSAPSARHTIQAREKERKKTHKLERPRIPHRPTRPAAVLRCEGDRLACAGAEGPDGGGAHDGEVDGVGCERASVRARG